MPHFLSRTDLEVVRKSFDNPSKARCKVLKKNIHAHENALKLSVLPLGIK